MLIVSKEKAIIINRINSYQNYKPRSVATVPKSLISITSAKSRNASDLSPLQFDKCTFTGKINSHISIANLQKHVNFLASEHCAGREADTQGSYIARKYIVNEFKEYGMEPFTKIFNIEKESYTQKDYVTRYHMFTGEKMGSVEIRNIIGYIPAKSDEYLFVTAHYDHLGQNNKGEIYLGAEDNASGIAAILEVARILPKEKLTKNLVFVATDAEEQGFLGAKSLAKRITVENIKNNSMILNLDGVGAKGNWLSIVGSEEPCFSICTVSNVEKLNHLVKATEKSGKVLGIDVHHYGENFTDARAFQQADIPAITYTWAKKGNTAARPNRLHVHTINDTPDKVQFKNVKKTAQILLNTILELCK